MRTFVRVLATPWCVAGAQKVVGIRLPLEEKRCRNS
jgi:hypothetical protein